MRCARASFKYFLILNNLKGKNRLHFPLRPKGVEYALFAYENDLPKALYFYAFNTKKESYQKMAKAAYRGIVEAMFQYGLKLKHEKNLKESTIFF